VPLLVELPVCDCVPLDVEDCTALVNDSELYCDAVCVCLSPTNAAPSLLTVELLPPDPIVLLLESVVLLLAPELVPLEMELLVPLFVPLLVPLAVEEDVPDEVDD
jgi:hypothetical protein